jgi:chromosome segregation ATPase
METIEELRGQGQVTVEQAELLGRIEEIRADIEFFARRVGWLEKLETLLKEKYRKKLAVLNDQFNRAAGYQGELKSLAKQLKKNKERQLILKKQMSDLEKRKKIIRQAMKQVTGYEKSSSRQIEAISEERDVLSQRVHDLMQLLELAEQAELSEQELEAICQRVCATKGLLEEHETDLRKRTIDLLFESYVPPKKRVVKW